MKYARQSTGENRPGYPGELQFPAEKEALTEISAALLVEWPWGRRCPPSDRLF